MGAPPRLIGLLESSVVSTRGSFWAGYRPSPPASEAEAPIATSGPGPIRPMTGTRAGPRWARQLSGCLHWGRYVRLQIPLHRRPRPTRPATVAAGRGDSPHRDDRRPAGVGYGRGPYASGGPAAHRARVAHGQLAGLRRPLPDHVRATGGDA